LLDEEKIRIEEFLMESHCNCTHHYHRFTEHFVYLISGSLSVNIDSKTYQVSLFTGLHIPSLTEHQITNNSNSQTRFLMISNIPSSYDKFIPGELEEGSNLGHHIARRRNGQTS